MLLFLTLQGLLKGSTAAMRLCVATCAEILGLDPEPIRDPARFSVPTTRTLQRAMVNLDMCMMLWHRHKLQQGMRMATCFLADASMQGREEYFCMRMDGMEIPRSLSSSEIVRLNPGVVFKRFLMPLATLGQGETDLEHKAARVVHAAWMVTGTRPLLDVWRSGVRGFCGDQGTERGLCDMPRVDDLSKVKEVLARHAAAPVQHVASDAASFFFPNAILITGPLHIVWNAFESAVQKVPWWPDLKEATSMLMSFLGHHGIRDRFLELCMKDAQASERRLIYSFKHKTIDWKWEYMEEAFRQLAAAIDTFLLKFDLAKMQTPIGHREGSAVSVDAKCLKYIKRLQSRKRELSSKYEALSTFARAVGVEARWFTGCDCHDHIWKSSASAQEQRDLFLEDTGGLSDDCPWRGRRGSALARGHWRHMHLRVRASDRARELQRRLTLNDADMRNEIVGGFEVMTCSWGDEVGDKFSYWDDLPHHLLGSWPPDRVGKSHARTCLQKWSDLELAGKADRCHRVTFKILHKDANTCFRVLLYQFADSGSMHPDLEVELREQNMAATCEQNVEALHAAIHQVFQNSGRNPAPPLCCAYVRQSQNCNELEDWRAKVFVIHNWRRRPTSYLLRGMFSDEFRLHAGLVLVSDFELGRFFFFVFSVC